VPYFRLNDIQRDIDVIEEVVRLYGYDKIPAKEYDNIVLNTKTFDNEKWDFVNGIRTYLAGRGFKEIATNPLVNEKDVKIFEENYITLQNPSSSDMTILRPNLYLGALETVKNNFNFKNNSLKLYEIGNVVKYGGDEKKSSYIPGIDERKSLFLLTAGYYDAESVNEPGRSFDLYDIKGEVQGLLEKLNIDNYKLNYYNYNGYFEYSLDYIVGKTIIAKIFKFSKKCLKEFDIDKAVFGCDISVYALLHETKRKKEFREFSKYPPVLRDLSVTVEDTINAGEVEKEIKAGANNLLKNIRLYDIYKITDEDKQKLSYTFSLEYSSDEKTLTDEEINELQNKIVKNLNKKLNAELRA
jgi:phenylalanyl-tRNA synthetase beta chain